MQPDVENLKNLLESSIECGLLADEMRFLPKCKIIIFDGITPPRSYKIAYAIINNVKLIKKQWLDDCLQANELLDTTKYIFNYDGETRKTLFINYTFHIDSEFEANNAILKCNVVCKKDVACLITAGGGSISENIRACDLHIVKKPSTKRKPNLPKHVKTITYTWVIDSLVEGKLMNPEYVNYTMA